MRTVWSPMTINRRRGRAATAATTINWRRRPRHGGTGSTSALRPAPSHASASTRGASGAAARSRRAARASPTGSCAGGRIMAAGRRRRRPGEATKDKSAWTADGGKGGESFGTDGGIQVARALVCARREAGSGSGSV